MFGIFGTPIASRQYAQCLVDEINKYIEVGAEPFLGSISQLLQTVESKHKNLVHREIFLLLSVTTRFKWIDQQFLVFKVNEQIKLAVLRDFQHLLKDQWGDSILPMFESANTDYYEPLRQMASSDYHDYDVDQATAGCAAAYGMFNSRILDQGGPNLQVEKAMEAIGHVLIGFRRMPLAKKHNYKQVRLS